MIEQRELRIGNQVIHALTGKKLTVVEIRRRHVSVEYKSEGKLRTSLVDYHNIQSVTIIQDRLISEGFQYVKPRKGIYFALKRGGMRIEVSNSGNYYFKKRVLTGMHQVQNIYFELTGKEL